MFLYELPKNLVEPYLNLANTLIHADGIVEESETAILQLYTTELHLDRLPELSIVDVESTITGFLGLSKKIKKEIYFELFSLAYADSFCSEEERKCLEKIADAFTISKAEAEMIENITIKLLFDYEQLGSVLND